MNSNDFLNDLFRAADSTYKAKDQQKLEIAFLKNEYEARLNEMWSIYNSNPTQIIEYNKQLAIIKDCGYKVYRNHSGKHKIVI